MHARTFTALAALTGITTLVDDVLTDMRTSGEEPPLPFCGGRTRESSTSDCRRSFTVDWRGSRPNRMSASTNTS